LLWTVDLQAVGHETTEALEVDLLCDVLGLDGVLLLVDCHHLARNRPGVLLNPLRQLFVVDVAEELGEVGLVDGLEGGSDDVADELADGILEREMIRLESR
jgi:hypothetical protein